MSIEDTSHYDSMVQRAELILKAISESTTGRSRVAVISRALQAAVDEAYERMMLAWSVLNNPQLRAPKHHAYRLQKAIELGTCFVLIQKVYDELCGGGVIDKPHQTEPTTAMLARAAKERDREYRRARTTA